MYWSNQKQSGRSACVIHIVDRIEEIIEKMKWKTIVEVGRVLPNDSTDCHTRRMHNCCGSSKSRALCSLVRTYMLLS